MEILLKLFLTFLKIGLVSIGGGYAVIPSIHEEVVVKAGWIGEKVCRNLAFAFGCRLFSAFGFWRRMAKPQE